MSREKSALPERRYYRLSDAAAWLSRQGMPCSAEDLLHYGVCGYLEILADSKHCCAIGYERDGQDDRGVPISVPFTSWTFGFDFVALSSSSLQQIEFRGVSVVGYVPKVYISTNVAFVQLPVGIEIPNTAFYEISGRFLDVDQMGGNPVEFTSRDLWIRTDELCRFQREKANQVRIDPPMPATPEKPVGPTEKSNMLAIIAALCKKAGIDIHARGAAVQLSKLTESFGTTVSDDTIGRRLKEIPRALESFEK